MNENSKNRVGVKEILALLAIAIIILFFYDCPILDRFGIPCPGCGMTRAFFCLLRGDIAGAFYYHPLFIVVIVAAIYLAVKISVIIKKGNWKVNSNVEKYLLILFVAIFLITYIIRIVFKLGMFSEYF